jgi:hypothetical protein
MRPFRIVALALGALMLAGVSSAQTSKPSVVSVSQLQEHCEANARTDTATATNDRSHLKGTDEMASMVCVGYILGTMDSLLDESSPYYITGTLHAGQAANIFLKYLQEHPEINRVKSARSVLISAWASAGFVAAKDVR